MENNKKELIPPIRGVLPSVVAKIQKFQENRVLIKKKKYRPEKMIPETKTAYSHTL